MPYLSDCPTAKQQSVSHLKSHHTLKKHFGMGVEKNILMIHSDDTGDCSIFVWLKHVFKYAIY